MARNDSAGFTLLEIMLVITVVGVVVVCGGAGLINGARLKADQVLLGRAQALDQAQIQYLQQHPGNSLISAGADAEIRQAVEDISRSLSGSRDPAIASILAGTTFDTSVRPAAVSYQGRQYIFRPGATRR